MPSLSLFFFFFSLVLSLWDKFVSLLLIQPLALSLSLSIYLTISIYYLYSTFLILHLGFCCSLYHVLLSFFPPPPLLSCLMIFFFLSKTHPTDTDWLGHYLIYIIMHLFYCIYHKLLSNPLLVLCNIISYIFLLAPFPFSLSVCLSFFLILDIPLITVLFIVSSTYCLFLIIIDPFILLF